MVFNVVVHVPVNPAIQRAHVYSASVQAMVDCIFGKACMLCKAEHDDEPMSIDAG